MTEIFINCPNCKKRKIATWVTFFSTTFDKNKTTVKCSYCQLEFILE